MADESVPDEMRNLWCNQPVEPVRIPPDDLRRKAQLLEAKFRRGFHIVAVLMISSAAGYASFLYFFPGTVHRIGASLTLAGYLYCAYELHKRRPLRAPADLATPTCAAYRAELERQRDFGSVSLTRFMLPFVPGPAVFMMGFLVPKLGFLKAAALTTAFIVWPFVLAIPLFRRKARTLQGEIDGLDALMRQS